MLHEPGTAEEVAAQWRRRYADVGVTTWALWVPSRTTTFDAPDELPAIPVCGVTRRRWSWRRRYEEWVLE
jgi:hypothetical protein